MTTSIRNNENADGASLAAKQGPSGKSVLGAAPAAMPKRALGDITNFATAQENQAPAHGFKANAAGGKLRRTAAAKVPTTFRRGNTTKNSSSNSAAARRAKQAALMTAARRAVSPMSTSTAPRRTSDRLAERAAAAAAAVSCKLDFASVSIDDSEDALDSDSSATLTCPPDVVDIDEGDLGDELANAQYAKEIHANFCKNEMKFMADPDYMSKQRDITFKMRAILVDWLVDVHQKFKLRPETLYLTVNIIDRFLEVKPVMRRKLQLVGVTATFIASKYEEIYAPEVADFVYIADKAYSKDEILATEAVILNMLNFDVTVPTSLFFLRRCLKAGTADSGCESDTQKHLALYLIELALQDGAMLKYRSSILAAAACHLASKLCRVPLPWSATMVFFCGGWTEADLAACEDEMRRLLEHERDITGTNKLTAVKRKFGLSKYSGVANNIPANLGGARPTNMEICPAQ